MLAMPEIIPLEIPNVITVADGKDKYLAEYPGELKAVGGSITTLGTGAGTSTDIMISNGATDMLSTIGSFEVDSATNLMEGQVVDDTVAAFAAGDVLEADCDAICGGADSEEVHIKLHVVLFIDDL
ncbi:MAG: hypothetical protein V3V32_04500 [Dehalococcoidia bacterium]